MTLPSWHLRQQLRKSIANLIDRRHDFRRRSGEKKGSPPTKKRQRPEVENAGRRRRGTQCLMTQRSVPQLPKPAICMALLRTCTMRNIWNDSKDGPEALETRRRRVGDRGPISRRLTAP
jgi:hypothetical protein